MTLGKKGWVPLFYRIIVEIYRAYAQLDYNITITGGASSWLGGLSPPPNKNTIERTGA